MKRVDVNNDPQLRTYIDGTIFNDDAANNHHEEIAGPIEAFGVPLNDNPDPPDHTQLRNIIMLATGLRPQGLKMTWVDASNLTIGPGHVVDSLRQRALQILADLTKDITANWAIGAAAGAMPATVAKTGQFTTVGTAVTGIAADLDGEFKVGDVLWSSSNAEGRRIDSISGPNVATIESAFTADVAVAENVQKNGLAPRTWYHTHILSTDPAAGFDAADIKVDWGLDTDIDATNLLSDAAVVAALLTRYRRINTAAYSFDGVGLVQVLQSDRRFQWGAQMQSGQILTQAVESTQEIFVPPIPCSAEITIGLTEGPVAVIILIHGILRSPSVADTAPTANNHNFVAAVAFSSFTAASLELETSDQTIKTRFDSANGTTYYVLHTHAFHDPAED